MDLQSLLWKPHWDQNPVRIPIWKCKHRNNSFFLKPEKQKDKVAFSYIWCFLFLFYKSVKIFPLHWGWSEKELREVTFQILLRVKSNFPKLWVKIELLERKNGSPYTHLLMTQGILQMWLRKFHNPQADSQVCCTVKILRKKARNGLSDPSECHVIKLGLLGASKGITLSSSSEILSPGLPTTHCWHTVL